VNIGDLVLSLIADGSQLTPGVEKEAGKAGDAGAKTLSAKLAAGLRTDGIRAFGAASAGAFAVATKGALEMEDAVARIRSETGASAEEAAQIARSANRIAGDQQQSLATVSDVAIAVRKNLGATGDELDRLTEATVKYARVTGQDAVAAVSDMDDIVDAYGLSLADVTKVQDQLVASNQKYGGSVEDNQKALAQFAPQLKALGATVDDGISLLNLFAASGVDASSAMAALNTAVTRLKPGETLNDLIRQVSSIEDPVKRAQKAVELFGAKGGVSLANVLKPGINGLNDFAVSADDAAGTVDASVDALDSSLGARLRKVLSQAQAALRGFGADLGPGITAAASVATLATSLGLDKAIAAAWGKVAASGVVKAAAGLAGAASGALYAAAAGAAETLATPMAAAWGRLMAVPAVAAAVRLAGAAAGEAFAAAAIAVPIIIPIVAAEGMHQGANDALGLAPDADQAARNKEVLRRFDAALARNVDEVAANGATQAAFDHAGELYGQATAAGLQSSAPKVTTATVTMVDAATYAGIQAAQKANAIGRAIPDNTADGIRARMAAPRDAFKQLLDDMLHAISPVKEQARLLGNLTSKKLRDGLMSGNPLIRRQAEETQTLILNRLEELVKLGVPLGKDAAQAVANGLHSRNPQMRKQAELLAKFLPDALDDQKGPANRKGINLGAAAANGLKSGFGHPVLTADIHVRGSSNTQGRALGGPMFAGTPYFVNERTAHSEIAVPAVNTYMLNHAQAVQALQAAVGGGDIHITVQAGNDVSPQRARLFGQLVADEVGHALRVQRRRTVGG
jgi:hypothetical protein